LSQLARSEYKNLKNKIIYWGWKCGLSGWAPPPKKKWGTWLKNNHLKQKGISE
jgi:hypothetical protein